MLAQAFQPVWRRLKPAATEIARLSQLDSRQKISLSGFGNHKKNLDFCVTSWKNTENPANQERP
jgi:hypothetical protein